MMLSLRNHRAAALAAFVLAGAFGFSAFAGDHRKHKRPDVDIESLKSEIRPTRDGWEISVGYKVEIKHYRRDDAYQLALRLTEHDFEVTDPDGRLLEFVIPLDRPTDVDDDELKFERRATIHLPLDAVGDPGHLKLHADVYGAGDDRSLDHKSKSVKRWKPPHRHHNWGLGIGVGIGCGVSVGVHVDL